MHKTLAILAAGCVCLTAGCGRSAETEKVLPEEAIEQEETESESADNPEEIFPEEGNRNAPRIAVDTESFDNFQQDTNQWLVHTEHDMLSVSGDGYEALSEAVHQWSEARAEEIEDLASEYAGYAEEEVYLEADDGSSLYQIYEMIEAARVDSRVLSIMEMSSDYTGGAHGSYGYYGYTFDAETGGLLELTDILDDAGGFQEAAADYMIQKLEETQGEGLFQEYEDTVRDIWTRNEGPNWYLDAAGITFLFNPYEIGPYAMGDVRVTLPYEEFESYIKDEYEYTSDIGSARIPENTEVTVFPGGTDGQEARIRIRQDAEEYSEGPVYVELNDSSVEATAYGWIESGYILKKESGKTFLILNTNAPSDAYELFIYDITDGTLAESDYMWWASLKNGVADTDQLTLRVKLDVLGSYLTLMDYGLGEDGKLTQQEEFFRVDSDGWAWRTMTTVQELPVTIDGEETVLPAGSRIRITATDNIGTALFYNESTMEDGEIHYTRGDSEDDSWVIYIDGKPDNEYFDMVPYAG